MLNGFLRQGLRELAFDGSDPLSLPWVVSATRGLIKLGVAVSLTCDVAEVIEDAPTGAVIEWRATALCNDSRAAIEEHVDSAAARASTVERGHARARLRLEVCQHRLPDALPAAERWIAAGRRLALIERECAIVPSDPHGPSSDALFEQFVSGLAERTLQGPAEHDDRCAVGQSSLFVYPDGSIVPCESIGRGAAARPGLGDFPEGTARACQFRIARAGLLTAVWSVRSCWLAGWLIESGEVS
jgi:hypothetical protein